MKIVNSVIEKYLPHIHAYCDTLVLKGVEKDDIRAQAYLGFMFAEKEFGKNRPDFWEYAVACMEMCIDRLRKELNRYRKLVSPKSLNAHIDSAHTLKFEDLIPDERENFLRKIIFCDFIEKLTMLQKTILLSLLRGYTLSSIKQWLQISDKDMKNAIVYIHIAWKNYKTDISCILE